MKKNNIYKQIIFVGMLLFSCGEEQDYFAELLLPADQNSVRIKFIHAASDTVGVNLFLNDVKITGNTSSVVASTGAINIGTVSFQNAYPITNYAAISSATGNFSIVVPEVYTATTTYPTKTMATQVASISASANYTVAFVGVSPSYEAVIYADDLSSTPINGKTFIRFSNFIHNSVDKITLRGTPPVDAQVNPTPTPTPIILFQNVAFKDMTGFIELPQTGTYTNVQILNANTNAVIATLATNVSTFSPNKVYTIFARGRIGVAGSPGVSRMINR